jgi:hypothetical protein
MENLNERMHTTEELKLEAKKMPEKNEITVKKVLGYSSLTPDQKAIFNYNLKNYNKAVKEYSNLRNAMLHGRVPDANNPKAITKLRKKKNNVEKIYNKYIAPSMKESAKVKTRDEVKGYQKKSEMSKLERERELNNFKDKVKKRVKEIKGE